MSDEPIVYVPIKSLGSDEVSLSSTLTARNLKLWNNAKANCFSGDAKAKFYQRWAIELGLVENIYGWDRGVTIALIQQGMTVELLTDRSGSNAEDAKSNIETISNHIDTLTEFEMGFVNGESVLTASLLRQLHEALLSNQQFHDVFNPTTGITHAVLKKGAFKKHSNDPVKHESPHEKINAYCPPENCDQQIIELCDMFNGESIQNLPAEIRSAWLHHRFAQIHPFTDGNGRVARTLASLVLLKAGLPPLIIRRDEDRSDYLDALELADKGNLQTFVDIIIERIKSDIFVLVSESNSVEGSIQSAEDSLLERIELRKERAMMIFPYAHAGFQNRFNTLAQKLSAAIYKARQSSLKSKIDDLSIVYPNHENNHSMDEVLKDLKLKYTPRIKDISAFMTIGIVTDHKFTLLIHLHERSVKDGSGFMFLPIMIEEELDSKKQEVSLLPVEPLLVKVIESEDNTTSQLITKWASNVVEKGISIWGMSQ